ncbi:predicted protein [Sclerotinia sclerotiorum 1980 UF-70]|uniref:Uncharacterized protein n=1 Tax=Sclerotinia sclerotiorum (strain ATCC 18683 / 1980 / Ss-1) TaxID=665079 RepID=A7F9L6_SCLS1|nr:predicted protein [Sclerotinia sclerotiorum 1980 UF-70]EDO00427.1 predicted protein [Sclerotinia sclerotiorum 1980 UF-70]
MSEVQDLNPAGDDDQFAKQKPCPLHQKDGEGKGGVVDAGTMIQ